MPDFVFISTCVSLKLFVGLYILFYRSMCYARTMFTYFVHFTNFEKIKCDFLANEFVLLYSFFK